MEKNSKRKIIIIAVIAGAVVLVITCIFILILIGLSDTESDLETTEPTQGGSSHQPTSEFLTTLIAQDNSAPISSETVPYMSVVQIIVEGEIEGNWEQWTGSGTIISPDGLILTNAHVALGDRFYPADKLIIALTVAQDKQPQQMFIAEVVQADPNLDVAVLQITHDLSGAPFDKNKFSLPHVSIGNSDSLNLGDTISILGYPGIGGETITLTRGEVSGFTSEEPYGDRAYIKTSATIAGGNSGGLAIDSNNRLIGIPTEVGSGGLEDEIIDCRPLADTNRDGYVDDYDTCVPTGGFINALRPIKLAMPLIEAAIQKEAPYTAAAVETGSFESGNTIILEEDFSSNDNLWPVDDNPSDANFFENGRYYIEVKEEIFLSQVFPEELVGDVIVEIDTRVEKSSEDGEYGIFCRYSDNGNSYFFEIAENGFFAIYKFIDDEWVALVDYAYDPYLENLISARIKASCIGNTLSFAIDDRLLASVEDDSFDDGYYGFFVWTFENRDNIISFDNLVVSRP